MVIFKQHSLSHHFMLCIVKAHIFSKEGEAVYFEQWYVEKSVANGSPSLSPVICNFLLTRAGEGGLCGRDGVGKGEYRVSNPSQNASLPYLPSQTLEACSTSSHLVDFVPVRGDNLCLYRDG